MDFEKQNYLAIDWGAATLGLALAHPETRVALAYGTLPNDASFLEALEGILEKEKVGSVILGVPYAPHARTSLHPSRSLGRILEERASVRVIYRNEMFTTKMAQQNLIARGEDQVAKQDDAEAARILLQEWLDTETGEE